MLEAAGMGKRPPFAWLRDFCAIRFPLVIRHGDLPRGAGASPQLRSLALAPLACRIRQRRIHSFGRRRLRKATKSRRFAGRAPRLPFWIFVLAFCSGLPFCPAGRLQADVCLSFGMALSTA